MASSVDAFREMHSSGLLVVPCAWDAASARVLARVPGVRALGTTSAGVAAVHGLPDGERMERAAMLEAVAAIVRSTALPVTADLEAGYGDSPRDVYETVAAAIARGVAGVNLEDARYGDGAPLRDPGEAAERVAAATQAAADAGVPIVVNARTDVWWQRIGDDPEQRFREGVDRLRRYRSAGADCLFAPGYPDAGDAPVAVARLVEALDGAPLNLLAGRTLPALDVLRELGVRRVSTGSGLFRLALAGASAALAGLLANQPGALAGAEELPYAELAAAMAADGGDDGR